MQLHHVEGPRELSRYSNSQQAERSGDQIRLAARFSVPVQIGPDAQPAPYTMGKLSFRGINGCGVALLTNPHLAPRLKKE